jgi:hypothetical protein
VYYYIKKKSEQQPKLHVDEKIVLNRQIYTVQQDAAIITDWGQLSAVARIIAT